MMVRKTRMNVKVLKTALTKTLQRKTLSDAKAMGKNSTKTSFGLWPNKQQKIIDFSFRKMREKQRHQVSPYPK
jgi:hypothetical protein